VEAAKSGARPPTTGAMAGVPLPVVMVEPPQPVIMRAASIIGIMGMTYFLDFSRFTILLLIWKSGEKGQGIGKNQYPHYYEKYPTNSGNYIGPASEPSDNRKRCS
jgi:hypothetical protein